MLLQKGMRATYVHSVTTSDLATNWRNDVPVMATPVLLWLAEITCMKATDHALEPRLMTLGFRHEMSHLAPTPEGWTITIEAELTDISDRLLTYSVIAHDGRDKVLAGSHIRAVVDRNMFTDRVAHKAALEMSS